MPIPGELFDCQVSFSYVQLIFRFEPTGGRSRASSMKTITRRAVTIGKTTIGPGSPLAVIAGPCVVESRDLVLRVATELRRLSEAYGIPLVFKSSYRKANRTSRDSFSGIGDDKALAILEEVRSQLQLPVVTDIHLPEEAKRAAEVVDMIQIPAFLCRQTDLLQAAGETGKAVNIKKGQFLAPEDMRFAVEKVTSTGNTNVLLTERGTTFGYHNLVVDMRSLVIMQQIGFPVILDATHSLQLPGQQMDKSGGQPEFIGPIARAGVAAGCDGIFLETHPDPPSAKSDSATQLRLDRVPVLFNQLVRISAALRDSADGDL
jgi:2-dehydro-3-deoxyphosphooctonate aldolase (KDO 8-P synthase)